MRLNCYNDSRRLEPGNEAELLQLDRWRMELGNEAELLQTVQ